MAAASYPASLPRRWAAWSLDALLPAALAAVIAGASLRSRHTALADAFDALLDAVLAVMLAALPQMPSPQGLLADPAVAAATTAFADALAPFVLAPVLAFALPAWLYGTLLEALHGATPGKRMLGLRVAGDGHTAGIARHALRQAAGVLSWLTLNLGHLLAAVPPRHQALHDRIAGLRVVASSPLPLPGWARGWLWLQAALGAAAMAWLLFAMQSRVDAALARAFG